MRGSVRLFQIFGQNNRFFSLQTKLPKAMEEMDIKLCEWWRGAETDQFPLLCYIPYRSPLWSR